MNPFSLLSTDIEEEFTNNPRRKLAKMKRKYLTNPTPDLKKRIEDMDGRLNPKKNMYKKKKKKKVEQFDLETEYQKNKVVWEEYRKKEDEERVREELKKERERQRQCREREFRERQFRERQFRERQCREARYSLPEDIQEFISSEPTKKMYNKLSRKYHPDKGGDEEMFKILNNHMNH